MTVDHTPESSPPRSRSFFKHLLTMPAWHKKLLALAMLFLGGGLIGQTAGYLSTPAPTTTTDADGVKRAYVLSTDGTTAAPVAEAAERPWWQRMSPTMIKTGFGFVAGFVIGWAFRAFLKIMSMITAVAGALILGLSYFNVLNINMTAAEKQYDTAIAWVKDQAERAKDAALKHIPGSASSFAGVFVGFKRK